MYKKKGHLYRHLINVHLCPSTASIPYLLLQPLHKADGVHQRLLLVASQSLQVQDGLGPLGFQHTDGLQQPLVTTVQGGGRTVLRHCGAAGHCTS